jgi:hypothetical protein
MAQRVLDLVLRFRSDKASVDQTVRDNGKIEKSLEDIQREINKTRESYERLNEASQLTAAAGAAVLAPLILSANKYTTAVGNAETTSRKWLASTKELSQNQVDLGRKATASLQPYLELAVKLTDEINKLPPSAIDAAVALGGALVLVGALGTLAAQIGKLTTSIQLLSANQGLKNAAVGVGAVGVGTFLGVKAVNQIGKATDDERLETFKFQDALDIAGQGLFLLGSQFVEAQEVFADAINLFIKGLEKGNTTLGFIFSNAEDTLDVVFGGIENMVRLAFLSIQRFLADISIKDPSGKIIDIEFDELLGLDKNALDTEIAALSSAVGTREELGQRFAENLAEFDENNRAIDAAYEERDRQIEDASRSIQIAIGEFIGVIEETPDAISEVVTLTQEALDAFADFQEADIEATKESLQKRVDIAKEAQTQELQLQENFERNRLQRVEDFERQIQATRDEFARQQAQKLEDFNREAAQDLTDFQRSQAQDEAAFYAAQGQAREQALQDDLRRLEDFNLKRQRAEIDHQEKLLDAAGRLDAIAVLNELRGFTKQQQRDNEDFSKESQRLKQQEALRQKQDEENFRASQTQAAQQFQREQQDKTAAFERDRQRARDEQSRREADQQAAFQRQQAQSKADNERQIAELRKQTQDRIREETTAYAEQRKKRQDAFTNQLAQLVGFQTREQQARAQHYNQLTTQLNAFIQRVRVTTTSSSNTTSQRQANPNAPKLPSYDIGGYTPPFGGPINSHPNEFMLDPRTTRALESRVGPLTQEKVQQIANDNSRKLDVTVNVSGAGNPTDVGRAVRVEIEKLLDELGGA